MRTGELSFVLSIFVIAALLVPTISNQNAYATITGGSVTGGNSGGVFEKIFDPIGPVGNNNFQSPNLIVFDEKQNFELTEPLTIDTLPDDLEIGDIVSSHYIVFDPVSTTTIEGCVQFDSDIFGVIADTQNQADSDILGNPTAQYLSPGARGLEAADTYDITGNREVCIDFTASSPGDVIRVITGFSPFAEPLLGDDFDDNTTNDLIWTPYTEGAIPPTVQEINQQLEVSFTSDASGANIVGGYASDCTLSGDYDIRADYTLEVWPENSGIRVGILTGQGAVERVGGGSNESFDEVYLTHFSTVDGVTSTEDLSGKLRFERIGDIVTGYYFDDGEWIEIFSEGRSTADTGFNLQVWTHDSYFVNSPVKVAFDNLEVRGDVSCPEAPEGPITAIQCDYDDETDVTLNGVFEYSVSGTCDIYRGDDAETKDVTINVEKEIENVDIGVGDGFGTLYVATDSEDFQFLLPDKIAKISTDGPNVVNSTIIGTDYPVNGLADGGDFMFVGTPNQNILQKADFDGNLLSTVMAEFSSDCCSEDMAYDPVATDGRPDGTLYHAHWPNSIEALDPVTGEIFEEFSIDQVVGMAYVNGEIWISKFSPMQVGPWNPDTNTFTPVFSTTANAGMLAYDPFNDVLWVGMSGGIIRPYNLQGNILGPDFVPFPGSEGVLDGGFFLGESSASPCNDQTGTFTISFVDESGTIVVMEEGEICKEGNVIEFSGDNTGVQGTGDYENIGLQCGNVDATVILNNDSASGTVSINQCQVVPSSSNGGMNNWDTRPSFGVDHETREIQQVDSGFGWGDQFWTIDDNHHTEFELGTIEIGMEQTFSATVWASKGLKVQEFAWGIPVVGEAQNAETRVEVYYDNNLEIEDVKVVQNSLVIDPESISVSHEKVKCLPTSLDAKCDRTEVGVTFLEPLMYEVAGIHAIDNAYRDQWTFLNEGFELSGESLNPMQELMIPSNLRDQGLLKVTQLAKYSPYWTGEDGRMFEMNSFGSFKEINQSFERFQDTGDARNRLHSGYGDIIQYEQNRALDVFDASQYKSELPESFAYIYPESGERITDELVQEMLLQEEIAKGILEQMDKQHRYN